MPNITLNGVAFNGSVLDSEGTLRAPRTVTPKRHKIGISQVSDNGTRYFIYASATSREKTDWELRWERVPQATRAAVLAVWALTATFTFIDPDGTSHTVQCETDDLTEEPDDEATLPDGTRYYNLTLTVRQP